MESNKRKTHIICFGNLWHGDDGFGVHVYNRLNNYSLAKDVSLFDGGILGFRALNYFEKCDRVIVIDAMEEKGSIGKLHELKLEDIEAPEQTFSSHAVNLSYLFHILPILFENKKIPKIDIFAVEINTKLKVFSDQLSEPIQKAVDGLIIKLKEEGLQIFGKDGSTTHHQR